MKPSRASLLLVVLALGTSSAAAQRARAAVPPSRPDGRAFIAPRYLHELESTPATTGPQVCADLDGDGDLDLLIPEKFHPFYAPTAMQTWLNDGHGGFTYAHRLPFDLWTPSDSFVLGRYVFAADFTGDGVPDLAYERSIRPPLVAPSGIFVHPGLGDGSFGPGLLLATNGPVQEFVAGDCDGDGDADLLVHESNTGTDYRNTLAWWHLEGDTFVSGARLSVDAETPLRLTAMDVGGDGIMDAVAGTFSGYDALQVFRTVNGVPTLAATVPLASELHDINQEQKVGDIDGDGRADVLMVRADISAFRCYLQPILATASGFEVRPLQVFQSTAFETLTSNGGALADWDADGDLDYVSPLFSWLENKGGARFEFAALQPAGGVSPPLHVIDVDGDGHLDVLGGRMFFRGDGTFPARTSVTSVFESLDQDWTEVEDWEGDGDLDLVGPFQLNLNAGDGSFVVRATPASASPYGALTAWGDFDGDGFRDVVEPSITSQFVFERMVLFKGTETGQYVLSPTVASPVQMPVNAKVGDLDGDGDVDILVDDGYWANDGTGRFGSAPIPAYAGTLYHALDVDGDGDVDLLVSQGSRLKLLWNLGGLSFASEDLGLDTSNALKRFLDADEDGDLDLVITAPSAGVVEVHEQVPGGSFLAPLTLDAPDVIGAAGQVDVDGDGNLDLVVSRFTPTRMLSAWPRGSGLSFAQRSDWVTNDFATAMADFDGDGDNEVLGARRFRNLQFDGDADGHALQYAQDAATAGTGGVHPVLGSGAPTRPGTRAELAIGRGRGGASGVLWIGRGRANALAGGIRVLVDAPQVLRSFVLSGAPGAPAEGSARLPLTVVSALIGRTFDFQAVLVDPGASGGLSATNGLEIRFGAWLPR